MALAKQKPQATHKPFAGLKDLLEGDYRTHPGGHATPADEKPQTVGRVSPKGVTRRALHPPMAAKQ
ncbi:hypothetical protein, partial [Thioalkalivibrio sp.]|uniref:hypothetical protein n=1 Tax=Thioalkalivibrio sp. TaxID=2093813 RepID=UPI0025E141FE